MPSLRWLATLGFLSILALAQNDYTCSPSKPCKIGCCGNSGYCGYGPTFCAQGNCTSSCNSKSECDAGWGPSWSAAEKCPLNVCCSKYGFCGTSADFCGAGNELVPPPSCGGGTPSNARTIAYYEGWSITRPCQGQYPENLDLTSYTHLNFAFGYIDPSTYQVSPMQSSDNSLYLRTTSLKEVNQGLKVFISIGGWSMNDPGPTAATFSNLAGSASNQQAFITSLISFLQTHGFDGVDLDWEYPVAPERAGNTADFANYVSFIKNLRGALTATGGSYGLTLTLPASYWYLRNFDIVNLEPYVDWFNFLSYDLHGTWDASDPYVGAVIGAHTNLTEINAALNLLWRNKIDPTKVVLGLGFYGRSFTLQNPSCNTAGCPFAAGGNPGPCTQTAGILSAIEIAGVLANGSAQTTWDKTAAVKVATFNGNQWVSYDDADTLAQKVNYANANCLGGTMVWAIDLDDGTLGTALSQSTGRQNLSNSNLPDGGRSSTSGSKTKSAGNKLDSGATPLNECGWTRCESSQTAAQAHCQQMGKVVSATTVSGCANVFSIVGRLSWRSFCCPPDNAPDCKVRTTTEKRQARCNSNEISVQYYSAFGLNGAVCCTNTVSDYPFATCQWSLTCGTYGSNSNCPSAYSNAVAWSSIGSSITPCKYPQAYALCCSNEATPVYCQTYDQPGYSSAAGNGSFGIGIIPLLPILGGSNLPLGDIGSCNGQCGDAQVLVGTDTSGCFGGYKAICCQQNGFPNQAELQSFKNKLLAFKNEPSCTTGQYNDILHSLTKRSQTWTRGSEWSADAAKSFLQARNLDIIGYADLDFLVDAALNSAESQYALQVTNIFDSVFSPSFYAANFTTVNDIATSNGASFGIDAQDPVVTFIELLCDYQDAQSNVATIQAVSDQICVNDPCLNGQCSNGGRPQSSSSASGGYSCSVSRKRDAREELIDVFEPASELPKDTLTAVSYLYADGDDEDQADGLDKRIILQGNSINPSGAGTNSGRIMRAIMGNDGGQQPPVLYFRTFQDPSNAQDTLMEIAWDIRGRTDLNGGNSANIFVVMHTHTNGLCNIVDANGASDWYPRIPRAHFYHGQAVQNIRGSSVALWAVQYYPQGGNPMRPNQGPTARTQVVNCRPANNQLPVANQRNWVPPFTLGLNIQPSGQANQPPFTNIPGGGQTQAFGAYLRQQGFYTVASYNNWNFTNNQWNTIVPATNANRLPNGQMPRDMAPGTADNWPQGDAPIN